ncbi:MAG: NAD(P)-dependent alcohol dehydrogenase [Thermomicrobiales bacterium]
MKAAIYTTYGPPERLGITDVPKPSPKADEVLVRIYATTVNRTDRGFLRGIPRIVRLFAGLRVPKNTILGNEFAGQVEAIGANVRSFQVGDRVFGYDDVRFGSHAGYRTMPESGMLALIPSDLGYEEAAPITEGAHYALGNLRKAGVAPGHKVMIYGATGAIGSAALQLAKHLGAQVTAVGDTARQDLLASLGADRVIDYTREDFTKAGQDYDFVFDAVGKSSFRACRELLKPGGIYCSSDPGFWWQNPFLALWTSRFGVRKVIFPIPRNRKEDVVCLKELVEAGEFKPVIDRRYPLDDIVEAFRYVETGRKTGNVVITVSHEDPA